MKKLIPLILAILLLAGCAPAKNVVTKESQALPIESIRNARELGGYHTQDGKTVKKGVLLRTAALTDISEEEKQLLIDTYHLSAVIDLRADYEVEDDPEPLFEGVSQYHLKIMDETLLIGRAIAISDVLQDPNVDVVTRMTAILESGVISDQMYVEFLDLEQGKEGYREFFRVLLNTPEGDSVLWHCTNGKDRAGVASMLLLGVLNVDEETIMQDFLLSNEFFAEEIAAYREKLAPHIDDPDLLDELLVTGRGVYAPYMQNAIDYIKEHYGDIPGYVKTELGLTDKDIETLKALYTE